MDDLINGFLALMDTPGGFAGPVNLGNPVESRISELAEIVLQLTGSKSEIVRKPLPEDDPTQRCPDISLARKELGWEPRVALRQGLERTIEYFDRLLATGEPTA